MYGITKLTYENGWVIGLGICDVIDLGIHNKQYYIFWGKTDLSLTIDNEAALIDDVMLEHNSYIKIPFFKDKNKYFTIMLLDRKEDYEVAEKALRAALINE